MDEAGGQERALDPVSRQAEVMFGLLMTLTFTGTMSVAMGEGQTVRSILLAALGCNIAWGIVDAVMYLLTTAAERSRRAVLVARLRVADPVARAAIVRSLLPEGAGDLVTDAEAKGLAELVDRTGPAGGSRVLGREDFRAAAAVFALVVVSTFPPILPFLFIGDVWTAMRVSNAIALVMLFVIGMALDRHVASGSRVMRWTVPLVGAVLVATTIALGG